MSINLMQVVLKSCHDLIAEKSLAHECRDEIIDGCPSPEWLKLAGAHISACILMKDLKPVSPIPNPLLIRVSPSDKRERVKFAPKPLISTSPFALLKTDLRNPCSILGSIV